MIPIAEKNYWFIQQRIGALFSSLVDETALRAISQQNPIDRSCA